MLKILKRYKNSPAKLAHDLEELKEFYSTIANNLQTDHNGLGISMDNLSKKTQEGIWYYIGLVDGLNKSYHLIFGNKSFKQIKSE